MPGGTRFPRDTEPSVMPRGELEPYLRAPSLVERILTILGRRTVGGALGAVVAAYNVQLAWQILRVDGSHWVHWGMSLTMGCGIGYGTTSFLQWIRYRLLGMLFSYQGWLYYPRATSTKFWGLLVKLLVGPGPYTTYQFQTVIPKLPLPTLADTLNRYLKAMKPLLRDEEFTETKRLVEDFQKSEGPILQKHIEKRYRRERNWLANWWLSENYLLSRQPTPINSNFYVMCNTLPEVCNKQLVRAANQVYSLARYNEILKLRQIPPTMIMDVIPVCMDGSDLMFGTCRLPGLTMDTIVNHPDSSHVVVIRNGKYYTIDAYGPTKRGRHKLLSRREIYQQLQRITDDAGEVNASDINMVASLTAQNRTQWYKDREWLVKNQQNAHTLHMVESAMFIMVLGHQTPKDNTEQIKLALTGDGSTRWFDKGLTMEVFENSARLVFNMEHSALDASIYSIMLEGGFRTHVYGPDGDLPDDGSVLRDLPYPVRLEWDLTQFQDKIDRAYKDYMERVDDLVVVYEHTPYGKGWIKSVGYSPDGFFQMAMQLAYYRVHKTFVRTYEPAATRLFAMGRTENINPISEESVKFVKAMEDPKVPRGEKIKCLKSAIKIQSRAKLDATCGHGCDRHMMGLYIASRELGRDVHPLFRDQAYQMPFKLSTSQVPTTVTQHNLPLDPCGIAGGFGPPGKDAYGILYGVVNDAQVNLSVTTWKSQTELDAHKFVESVMTVFNDLRELIEGNKQ